MRRALFLPQCCGAGEARYCHQAREDSGAGADSARFPQALKRANLAGAVRLWCGTPRGLQGPFWRRGTIGNALSVGRQMGIVRTCGTPGKAKSATNESATAGSRGSETCSEVPEQWKRYAGSLSALQYLALGASCAPPLAAAAAEGAFASLQTRGSRVLFVH